MLFKDKVVSLVKSSGSNMMVVVFYKADGTLRTMYCKKGITRPSKRGASKAKKRTYTITKKREAVINVWDCQAKAYRFFKPESVVSISNRFVKLEVSKDA